MVNILRELQDGTETMRVLEIGCSSGYYSEAVRIAGLDELYTGCDCSAPIIATALQCQPGPRFDVQGATTLKYADNAYDDAIFGCCLLPILQYQTAVAETPRIVNRYAIFHRSPLVLGQQNKYYWKRAYGVEAIEIHFNEPHFLPLLADSGLEMLATYTLDETVSHGVGNSTRTYVCH